MFVSKTMAGSPDSSRGHWATSTIQDVPLPYHHRACSKSCQLLHMRTALEMSVCEAPYSCHEVRIGTVLADIDTSEAKRRIADSLADVPRMPLGPVERAICGQSNQTAA